MVDRPQFRTEVLRPTGDVAVVVVQGEVDLFTAPQLHEALISGIEDGVQRLIVDLSEAPFIDSTGLGVLVAALRRLQSRGGHVDVVCGRANVVRTFEVSGLLGAFGLYATREEALATARSMPDQGAGRRRA